jgi:group I intron endonuclease
LAYIYKIENIINHKIYIGQTNFSLEKRFKEHCKDAYARDKEQRPLYAAMRKYGIENFQIFLVEETSSPQEREIFWIEQYRSFKNGYNATQGGEGTKYLDYDLVLATYQEIQNCTKVAEKLNISRDSVSAIVKSFEEKVLSATEVGKTKGTLINQYDLKGNFIQTFPSIKSAAKFLGVAGVSHISDVCKGTRKTAYGYIWKYSNL